VVSVVIRSCTDVAVKTNYIRLCTISLYLYLHAAYLYIGIRIFVSPFIYIYFMAYHLYRRTYLNPTLICFYSVVTLTGLITRVTAIIIWVPHATTRLYMISYRGLMAGPAVQGSYRWKHPELWVNVLKPESYRNLYSNISKPNSMQR